MITAFYTCPRPEPYIGQTLNSYFNQTNSVPMVFEEPETPSYQHRTRVHRIVNKEKLGLVGNWLNMVKWLYSNINTDYYMLCEDDISFEHDIPSLPPKIADYNYYSLYCSKVNQSSTIEGWQEPNMRNGFCGALCVILPRLSLKMIVEGEQQFRELTKGYILDYAIGEFLKPGLVYYPTRILHIGAISTRESNNSIENREHPTRMPAI